VRDLNVAGDVEKRNASLDAFRVVAVTCIMLAHGSAFGMESFRSLRYVAIVIGVVGVELFFVLSGFLIGQQLLNVGEGNQGVKNFWARRWFRTLPNYYLFLLINLALFALILKRPTGDLSLIFFSHNLVAPFADRFFAESWSLAVEEWFYLLAPLLVFVLALLFPPKHRKLATIAAMLTIIVICTMARIWAAQFINASIDSGIRKIVLLRLDALAFGVLLAWLARYRPLMLASLARSWWPGALLLLPAIAYLAFHSINLTFHAPPIAHHQVLAPLLFTLLPIACTLLLARAQAMPMQSRAWLTNQSQWSYSIYLLHLPLLLIILHFTGELKNPIIIALVFVAWYTTTIIGAAAIYRWFEKPIMDLRKRFAPL
jgi:peptidoglycan/LPS O-acetylase OafA/YrhL